MDNEIVVKHRATNDQLQPKWAKNTLENDLFGTSIPKVNTVKELLETIGRKFTMFDKNDKHHYLNLLNSTMYDGVSGLREQIHKFSSCYQKLSAIKTDLGEDFLTWSIMKSLHSQFDSIKSNYNTLKVQWSLNEMTVILVKEEDEGRG
ncbi:hypothetical protein FNV43_RR15504 [Rhamnella rubrinervis]|uniref:Uncharacterized protein n=1 Tax=Rhamnella rubrinervis TaxID=2594499 RepID=A0A8K0E1X1_9ROSA|nr:hypothetical protein FNV43_RR15504 [Rhamnella rubrinervis]